jgi:two-component system chemotaxis sensor kinase CheA
MADKETYDDYANASFEAELEEVWALFAEDGREALDTVEETLLTLESAPTDAEQIVKLFRALHTFKGNARMMGLDVVESVAHHAEDLVALVRDRGVTLTSVMVDLLLEVLDRLREVLNHALTHRRDIDVVQVEEVMAQLKDMLAEYEQALPSQQVIASEELDEDADDLDDLFDLAMIEELEKAAEPALSVIEQDAPIEMIDPATDPEYVRIFLAIADEGMERLHTALGAFATRSNKKKKVAVQDVEAVSDSLLRAAGRMGYEHLVAILDDLVPAAKDLGGKARVAELEKLTATLSQELAAIRGMEKPSKPEESTPPPSWESRRDRLAERLEIAMNEALATDLPLVEEDIPYRDIFDLESSQQVPPSPRPSRSLRPLGPIYGVGESDMAMADLPETTRLFRRWCKKGLQADLARLNEITDGLEQFTRQFLVGGSALAWDDKLVSEVAYLLRAIYHSCVFHRLDQEAYVILALEDLYARVAEGDMALSETLLDLTRACVAQLNTTVESACVGQVSDTNTWADLLDQVEEILYMHARGRVFQVTQDVLNLLDLSPDFREVVTRENLLEVSRALQTGKTFYTVLADLNEQEEIGQAFYKWSRSNGVRLITNVTVFQDNRTLFRFLVTTSEPQETVLETFAEMDPQGRYLSLEKCTWQEEVDIEEVISTPPAQPVFSPTRHTVERQSTVSGDALADFLESVGEMVATRATLHRVTQRLTEVNLAEDVNRLMRQSNGDWQHVRQELQTSLGAWTDDLSTLSHAETELGAALDRFQEVALALRARPAAEILDPLQRLVRDVAQHLGKMVKLDVIGADVGLDHSALDVLADPVRRLVWFAVAHSIEKPVQRREAGKLATGRVSVVVRKAADHVQIVIEDDGCGIDSDAVLERARELGWTKAKRVSAHKLSEWVLRKGFGMVGGSYEIEGIDLTAINTGLQTHRGRLSVVSEPGHGARFSLHIPLDMVVIDGMVMRVADVHYVVPIEAVRRIVSLEKDQLVRSSADGGRNMLRLEEELIPIRPLRQGLGLARSRSAGENIPREGLLLVVETGERDMALPVDELIGQQQVLIQPLQGRLTDVQGISGCALLGEGDVGMLLNLDQISA